MQPLPTCTDLDGSLKAKEYHLPKEYQVDASTEKTTKDRTKEEIRCFGHNEVGYCFALLPVFSYSLSMKKRQQAAARRKKNHVAKKKPKKPVGPKKSELKTHSEVLLLDRQITK